MIEHALVGLVNHQLPEMPGILDIDPGNREPPSVGSLSIGSHSRDDPGQVHQMIKNKHPLTMEENT